MYNIVIALKKYNNNNKYREACMSKEHVHECRSGERSSYKQQVRVEFENGLDPCARNFAGSKLPEIATIGGTTVVLGNKAICFYRERTIINDFGYSSALLFYEVRDWIISDFRYLFLLSVDSDCSFIFFILQST